MKNFDANKQNYADMTLQILSAYLSSGDDEINYDLAAEVMDSMYNDPDIKGPGFTTGLFFASVIHMSLMLQVLSATYGIPKSEALSKYAMTYEGVRNMVVMMPQVHPFVVNEIVEHLKED